MKVQLSWPTIYRFVGGAVLSLILIYGKTRTVQYVVLENILNLEWIIFRIWHDLKVDEETATRAVLQQGEDLPIEGLIFPRLIREGVGQRCYYCWTKTGYSVAFTSLGQYAKHVLYNHEGYSIYVFDSDIQKYNEELTSLRRNQMAHPKEFRQP